MLVVDDASGFATPAASYLLLTALTGLGVALVSAKLLTDTTLYVLSFVVQRRFIFARRSIRSPQAAVLTPSEA